MSSNREQKPKGYSWPEWKKLVWFLFLILIPGVLLAMLLKMVFGIPGATWIAVLLAVIFVVLVIVASYLVRQEGQQHERTKLYVADSLMIAAFSLWFYGYSVFGGRDGWTPLVNGVVIGVVSVSYIIPRTKQ